MEKRASEICVCVCMRRAEKFEVYMYGLWYPDRLSWIDLFQASSVQSADR